MNPTNPNAMPGDDLDPMIDPTAAQQQPWNKQQPPPPTADGGTADVVDAGAEAAGLGGMIVEGAAEIASGAADVAGGAIDAVGSVAGGALEGASGCADGCGGCSLAFLLLLFGGAGTAMALFR